MKRLKHFDVHHDLKRREVLDDGRTKPQSM